MLEVGRTEIVVPELGRWGLMPLKVSSWVPTPIYAVSTAAIASTSLSASP